MIRRSRAALRAASGSAAARNVRQVRSATLQATTSGQLHAPRRRLRSRQWTVASARDSAPQHGLRSGYPDRDIGPAELRLRALARRPVRDFVRVEARVRASVRRPVRVSARQRSRSPASGWPFGPDAGLRFRPGRSARPRNNRGPHSQHGLRSAISANNPSRQPQRGLRPPGIQRNEGDRQSRPQPVTDSQVVHRCPNHPQPGTNAPGSVGPRR